MGDLSCSIFGETLAGDGPGLLVALARDDADANSWRVAIRRLGAIFVSWLRVVHRRGAERVSGGDARLRRCGDENVGHQLGRKGGRQAKLADRIEFAGLRDGGPGEQLLDDDRVLPHAVIALVVRGEVVQGEEIVLESPSHHVESDAPSVEMAERGDHLRDGEGMHVRRLNGDERAQGGGVLNDDVADKPRVDQRVVRVDEDALAAVAFAPAGDLGHRPSIEMAIDGAGHRAGGKELNHGASRGCFRGRGGRCPRRGTSRSPRPACSRWAVP